MWQWLEWYPKDKIYVLDGGLASELENDGFSLQQDPLWSARMLHENPDAIVAIHDRYLTNGAEILTTASYQASIPGFQKHLGITVEESKRLIKSSVKLARKAIDEHRLACDDFRELLIAGSVGPYGAALADGSEYTGDYCDTMTEEELMNWHRPRIECLVEAGVDLLAFETIPAFKEAKALMKLLKEFPDVKAWLSFSCQSDSQTSHKDDIATTALTCVDMAPDQLIAIGVNCCPPDYVASLLKKISKLTYDFPLIAYPNSGEKYDSKEGWSGEKVKPNSSYLESWVKCGARIIGGCCRTTPEDIIDIYGHFHPGLKDL